MQGVLIDKLPINYYSVLILYNADKLLVDVPYSQDCDIVIGLYHDDVPFVKVVQRYIPEEIVRWYNKENN